MKKQTILFLLFLFYNFFKLPCQELKTDEALYKTIKNNYENKNWDTFHRNRLYFIKNKNNKSEIYARVLEYCGAFFRNINKQDSAYYYYYKTFNKFKELNDTLNSSKMLLNIAIIQKNSRDYVRSESSSFQAINYFLKTKEKRIIASLYNNLGIIYNYTEDFKNSLKYHLKALKLRESIKGKEKLVIHSLNNIGNVYREQKEFKLAIKHYKKGLGYKNLNKDNPRVYAMLLDNLGYTYLLNKQHKNLPNIFFKSKKN